MTVSLAIVGTLFLWWFSTGLILWLDGLPRRTYRYSFGGASLVAIGALFGLERGDDELGALGAVIAFTASLIVWGWFEMSFLMGYITGPRRTPCPPGARGWRRARYAFEAVLHHELALAAGALLIAALTIDGRNQTGLYAYLILWAMRSSAKLNVFLGVRNLSEAFLPEHLRYLQTYFRRRPMNPLLPFTMLAATAAAVRLWRLALAAPPGGHDAVSLSLLAMLLSLAVLEHAFLVMPVPADALWKWGLASRAVPVAGEPGV